MSTRSGAGCREHAAQRGDQDQRTRVRSVGPGAVRAGEQRRHDRPIMTRWQSLIRLPRRPLPAPGVCARCGPLPYRGAVMRNPESFDAYYVGTRARFLHEAYALTGDAPAARAALQGRLRRRVAPLAQGLRPRRPRRLRPRLAHGRARRRHTARIWHRDKGLDPEVAATFEALSKLTVDPAPAPRPDAPVDPLDGRHRPHGRARPRRCRARAADGLVAVRPAPRRAHDRHPRPAGGPGPAPRGRPLAPGHGHPAHRRRPTPYAHGGGGRARLGRAARLRLAGRLRLRRRGHQPGRRDGHPGRHRPRALRGGRRHCRRAGDRRGLDDVGGAGDPAGARARLDRGQDHRQPQWHRPASHPASASGSPTPRGSPP